jgi:outer membrane protein assembly factor BamB
MDSTTGMIIWSSFVGGTPNSPITVANGKVYSGTHNFDNLSPTLAALDELTGIPVWTYSYADSHQDSVAFINSNGVAINDGDGDGDLEIYFGVVTWIGSGDQAIALDEATGKEVWTQKH